MKQVSIPVIDLFAGPGGLAEGFSAVRNASGERLFDVRVSIEKDPVAHRTLFLRALYRGFPDGGAPDAYYDYIRGSISRDEFLASPAVAREAQRAAQEARNATLGETPAAEIDEWIQRAVGGVDPWVLIGGPPCQAYSLVGRSRMRGADPKAFEEDKRHFLYREYLRIIRRFSPAIFVMENVKGILSSTHGGSLIFERILEDLASPGGDSDYEIRSFVVPGTAETLAPGDFVIRAEEHGVPQMRHRVILFGIRRDLARQEHETLARTLMPAVSVNEAISGLPALRSRLSKENDSFESWLDVFRTAARSLKGWKGEARSRVEERMRVARDMAVANRSHGAPYISSPARMGRTSPSELQRWFEDSRLGGVILHEARSHMRPDLHRYLFAACYAAEFRMAPKLAHFPKALLPNHGNADDDNPPFADRFRVQLAQLPSTTVVSHIAKDGHYYIHPDPSQCRSLTVREAARLQTFPDNYFFEGNRTQQYTQVGNAVPPYLARQIAEVVGDYLGARAEESRSEEVMSEVCLPDFGDLDNINGNRKADGASGHGEATARKGSDFVFAVQKGGKYGVVLSRHYAEILEKFHRARNNARTWGEFMEMLGSKAANYIVPFTQCDDPKPVEDDLLDGLVCREVYVLSTDEFPLTQCAEETYTNHGRLFPKIPGAKGIRTEYGQRLELYPVEQFRKFKRHMDRQGYSLEEWECPCQVVIVNYSQ